MLTVALLVWALVIGNTFISTTNEEALFWFRLTNFSSVFIPLCIHYLILAIANQNSSINSILFRMRYWTSIGIGVAFFTLTPWFCDSVVVAEIYPVPRPEYRAGVLVFGLFMGSAVVYFLVECLKLIRVSKGILRTELQYVLLGGAVGVVTGLLSTTGVQVLKPGDDAIIYAPLSALSIHLTLAYGIATKRLMGIADVLRRVMAYGVLFFYMATIFAGVQLASEYILIYISPDLSFLSFHFAAIAVIASVAPANSIIQKFSHHLFLRLETLDVGRAIRQFNREVRPIKATSQLFEAFSKFIGQVLGTDSVFLLLPTTVGYAQVYPNSEDALRYEIKQKDPLVTALDGNRMPIFRDLLRRSQDELRAEQLEARLSQLHVSVVSPISSKDQLMAILLLGERLSGKLYGGTEQDLLQAVSSSLAIVLENSLFFTEVENAKVYNDLLLDNLVSAVIATDAEGRITVCNKEAARLLNVEASAIIQTLYTNLPTQISDIIYTARTSGRAVHTQQLNLQMSTVDEATVRITCDTVRNDQGGVVGILLVMHDETEIRHLENLLRRSDRLARLGSLSATMAHKIKVPLLVIKSLLKQLPNNFSNEKFREQFLDTVGYEVKRIDTAVRDLLRFARAKEPAFIRVSIDTIVQSAVESIQLDLDLKKVMVTFITRTHDSCVEGDADLLRQVFVSSLLNVLEGVPSHSQIQIEIFRENAAVDSLRTIATHAANCLIVQFREATKNALIAGENSVAESMFKFLDAEQGLGFEIARDIMSDHGGQLEVSVDSDDFRIVSFIFPVTQTVSSELPQ